MISLVRNVRQLLQPDAADLFSSVSAFSRVQATPFSSPAPLQVAPTFFPPPPPPPPPLDTTPVFQPQPPLEGQGLGVYSPEYLSQASLPGVEPGIEEDPLPASYPFLNTDTPETPLVIPVDNNAANESLSTEEAESIASDIAGGKTIDQVASEYGVSRQDVIDQLETDSLEVEATTTDEGDQNTTITDSETDDTVAEYSVTEQQDGVEVEEFTNADGETTTTVTDESGQRIELDADQQTTREGINDIVDGVADGQSIEEIADAQGLTHDQVIAQLEAAGYEYESSTEGEGPSYTPTTRITSEDSGDLVVSYEINPSGSTTSVVNDTDGNEIHRVDHSDGSSTETVTEPDGRETVTTEDADGKTTTTETYEQNGVTVEEVTDNDGQTTTTIIDEDDNRTELDNSQDITREGIDDIVAAVANGKSIEEIATQNDLTQAQVEAQLRAAGYVVETRTDELANGGDQYTTEVISADDAEDVIASHSNGRGTTPETSLAVDSNGTETRTTEYNNGRRVETVTRDDGRETTTDVDADGNTTTSITDNGYTLTTHPDGDLTLQRNEDGTEINIEEGTAEASLADTLMEINPESEDTTEARAAEVVQTAIEGMMAGERIEDLQPSVDDKTEELNQAIEDYGSGVEPENNVTTEDPYGDPPAEEPPSGGTWVPMNGVWMDSAVARATLELNELVSEQLEASSEFEASQAQLDVYALDSDYDGALDRAQQILDEALAPHGLVWVCPEEPSGSLADARQRLDDAEAMVEQARGASTEYADAQDLLDEAISASDNVPEVTTMGICTAEDTPDDLKLMQDQYEREQSERDAALANIDSLFYDMGLHNANGNNFMADYSVGFHEQQLADAEPGSKQHEQLTDALEEAQQQQEDSSNQVDVAQAYSDFYHVRSEQAQLTSDAYDIRDDLLEAFNEEKGLNEEGKEFRTVGGDYLGEVTGEQVIEEREDGLWVTTHFEHGTTEEQLAPEEMSEFWEENRDPEVTANWLEHLDERQGAHEQVSDAKAALFDALEQDYGIRQEDLAGNISDLETELGELFDEHGQGTTEAPEDAVPDGTPDIGTEEQPVLVTQDVKDTFDDKGLLAALSSSDQPVGIEIDGETRWVHPDIAITTIALEAANANHQALGDARQELTQASERSSLMAEQPAQRMGESDMDFDARQEFGVLEDDSAQALDDLYQPKFQQLADQGYDNEFTTYKSDELEPMLDERFGLNRNTDERSEALDEVLESIHDIGGGDPQINIVPMFHVDEANGVSQVNLIAVQGDDGEVRYVDMSGKHYSDIEDFRDNNQMFSDDGKLVAPRDFEMSSEAGKFDLEVVDAHATSTLDSVVDPLVGIGTGIATVLSFTPAAPVAAPLAYAGGAYLGGRALLNQIDHVNHGGDWNDAESWLNYGSIATTAFPIFSSGFRTVGMAGRSFSSANSSAQVTRGQAFLASIGGVKPGSNVAEAATTFMSSGGALNRVARGFDWAAIATGVPLMGYSAYSLYKNGDQMSGLQLTDAIVGLTTGFAGTGLGAHGLWTTRPSRSNGADTSGSNTLQLHDESGNVIDARILGNSPEGAEHVYLQPEIGPRPRGDEAGVSDKTHILHRDPQSGEAYVMPWIRGASEPANTQSNGVFTSLKEAWQQRIAQGENRGIFRYFRPGRDNQEAIAIREELGLPSWVNDGDLQTIAALKQLSPDDIATLSVKERQSIESWHLLLLSREQLEAWPAPPEPTQRSSWEAWHERSRSVSLKNTAEALLEPSAIRPRLSNLMGDMTPSHTQETAVFRGDTRGPDTVFDTGFQPRNPSDPESGISTSLSARKARWWANERAQDGDSWVYTILRDVADGDMFSSLPARPPGGDTPQRQADINHYEIRFTDGVTGQDILSARRVDADGNYVGTPVYNPNFKDPAKLPDASPTPNSELGGRVIGHPPESVDNIYVPLEIGPRPRGDEPGVADKTHILYRDPETGETYILPWIRGASEVPGSQPVHTQQTSTPPAGMAQLYRLGDLGALNQASQDGALPPGHFVHIVRSSNSGIDSGNQVINGGTVPKSGRVNDDGRIVWPSTRPEDSVRLSLEPSSGQQQLHIANTSGDATPRALNVGDNTHFIVLSTDRVSDFRAQVQGGGLPFALHDNGQWTLAANQATTTPPPQTGETAQTIPAVHPTNEATPAASQAAPEPDFSVTNGEITLHQDGDIVHLSGLDTNLSSVIGQSNRRRGTSLYDRNADAGARPDTVTLPRDVLELALSPEAAARLPDGESIQVALVADPEAPVQSEAPISADTSPSNSRRHMARLLAALGVGGSLYGVGSAHAWTGDVLNRAASPESPALLFNGSGFIARGVLNALKAGFDGKLKANGESLANGELSAQLLNWEASRILASRRALNLNNEQIGQISGLIEALWGRHQLLDSLPVTQASEQRGWTAEAKNTAIKQQVDDYYRQLASITGKTVEEVKGISPLDSQNPKGIAFNSSILATHLVNDIVSWQYLQHQAHNGELFSLAPLDLVGNLGLAGFLAANVALAGSAAIKVGTGLVRVNLNSLRLTEKLTSTSTFLGSYLYGIMTPPWAALTLNSAATAFSEGNWLAGSINMAAIPFQVGLSYYGLKGLRDDSISMVKAWKNGADLSEKSWPMRSAFAAPTFSMAALTGTAAGMQLAEGNLFAASVLGGGTALQAYFISLAARLNWHDSKARHNPLFLPMSEQAKQVDANRLWQGVGWTLAAGMLLPGVLDLREWLNEKEMLPEWEWLIADLDNDPVTTDSGAQPPDNQPAALPDGQEGEDHHLLGLMPPPQDRPLEYVAGQGHHRINPDLEHHQGYYSVEVQDGQTLGSIILNHGHQNVTDVVAMNMEHITDPTSLRVGDRIYLPRETA